MSGAIISIIGKLAIAVFVGSAVYLAAKKATAKLDITTQQPTVATGACSKEEQIEEKVERISEEEKAPGADLPKRAGVFQLIAYGPCDCCRPYCKECSSRWKRL